jgi:hypothetical protein
MSVKTKSIKEVYQIVSTLLKSKVEEIERESLRLYLNRHLQSLKA